MEESIKEEIKVSPPPKPDISKSVVIILVILSVVISMVGTWVILGEVNSMQSAPVLRGESSQAGQVKLSIIDKNLPAATAIGQVSITILNPEEQ
ncbi:MAG: hypothetical protein KKF44_10150 [Nanoarchaeota archaeon]|nr:hypothetical protein [Nanoarchaeota archaeon]